MRNCPADPRRLLQLLDRNIRVKVNHIQFNQHRGDGADIGEKQPVQYAALGVPPVLYPGQIGKIESRRRAQDHGDPAQRLQVTIIFAWTQPQFLLFQPLEGGQGQHSGNQRDKHHQHLGIQAFQSPDRRLGGSPLPRVGSSGLVRLV